MLYLRIPRAAVVGRRLRHRMRLAFLRTEGAVSGLLPVILHRLLRPVALRWRLRHGTRLCWLRAEGPEARLRGVVVLRRPRHVAVLRRHLLALAGIAVHGLLLNFLPGLLTLPKAALRLRHLLPLLRIASRLSVARAAFKRLILRHLPRTVYLLLRDSGAQRLLRVAVERASRIVLQSFLLSLEGNWARRGLRLHYHLARLGAFRRRGGANISLRSQDAVA